MNLDSSRRELVRDASPEQVLFLRRPRELPQLTVNSELKRTRGIQLFNKNIAL